MADYSQTAPAGQSSADSDCCYLRIPSYLPGFIYDDKTTVHTSESEREVFWFEGKLKMPNPSWSALNADAGCTATKELCSYPAYSYWQNILRYMR